MHSEKSTPKKKAKVLKKLRDRMLVELSGISLYPYQRTPSDAIIDSVVQRDGKQFFIEFSRQSGKSELVCDTALTLAVNHYLLTGRAIRIGIFAPKYSQTDIIFKRFKERYDTRFFEKSGISVAESNGTTFRLSAVEDGQMVSIATIMTITAMTDTTIKGETFDFIIIDEAQDVSDLKIAEDIIPMGAATRATLVCIGTPAVHFENKFFFEGINRGKLNENVFVIDWKTAAQYNKPYEDYVLNTVLPNPLTGPDSDAFKTQFELLWVQEVAKPFWNILEYAGNFERVKEEKQLKVVAGVDVAKEPDSTVVTILYQDPATKVKRVLDWLELRGTNYDEQVEVIREFLSHYDIERVIIDSVGVGDPVLDLLKKSLRVTVEGYKWTAESHHTAFSYLAAEYAAKRLEFPGGPEAQKTREFKQFVAQMQWVEKKYQGNLLKVHHPEGKDYHDDYVSSLCLAFHPYHVPNKYTFLRGLDKVTGWGGTDPLFPLGGGFT